MMTKLLGRFYPQVNYKLIFNNQLSNESFSSLRTVFFMFCKAVSYIKSAVGSVRPRTMAKLIVTYRHTLQKIKVYRLERVKPYEIHLIPAYMTILFKQVTILIQIVSKLSISRNSTLSIFWKAYL